MRFFSLLIILFIAMTALAGCGAAGPDASHLVIVSANGDHRFTVEIADSPEERQLGLMYRDALPEEAGMLFDFGHEPQVLTMWMKNTLIPLDMAFIDGDGVIRRIAPMTTPRSLESVPSGAAVVAVLEVNGGTLARLGVKTGDKVRHPIFNKE